MLSSHEHSGIVIDVIDVDVVVGDDVENNDNPDDSNGLVVSNWMVVSLGEIISIGSSVVMVVLNGIKLDSRLFLLVKLVVQPINGEVHLN